MALAPGTIAPDFSLKTKTADGMATINLADHRGKDKVVLLFFPGAFTGPCTEEMCSMSENLNAYKDLGAVVYGISIDNPFAQEAFAKANHIMVPLLSDYSKSVIQEYDVVLDDFAGLGGSAAQRAVFVIDKAGQIIYSQQTAAPGDMPDFEPVKAVLA